MENFDIAKYLKENKLGSYGMFNGYVDIKPLKEEEDVADASEVVPYEGADDQLTGLGDEDTFEQDEIVSEGRFDRIEGLIDRRDLSVLMASTQRIFDNLTDDGFEAEDVEKYLINLILKAAAPYK